MLADNFIDVPLTPENMDLYPVRQAILSAIKHILPDLNNKLLDIGCGHMPYKKLFLTEPSQVSEYIGLDIQNDYQSKTSPNLFWNGKRIPLQSESINCSVATELFEHCPDPDLIMEEIYRVLIPDGFMFFTVPFLWPLHDVPYDEYRYTPFALERLLKKSGFGKVSIHALGGWNAALAQIIGLWINRNPEYKDKRAFLRKKLFSVFKLLLRNDSPPTDFTRSTMITGLWGTAYKI